MQTMLGLLRHSAHMFSADAAAFVRSPACAQAFEHVSSDADMLATLTGALLDNFALCALEGYQAEQFSAEALQQAIREGQNVSFCLRFDRVSNFVTPVVTLPASSPQAAMLFQKVRGNLASKMYKAAVMHRRLEKKRTTRYSWLDRKGRKAYDAVIERLPMDIRGNRYPTEGTFDGARAAMLAITEPAQKRFEARVQAVAKESHSAIGTGSFSDIVLNFTLHYVVSPLNTLH